MQVLGGTYAIDGDAVTFAHMDDVPGATPGEHYLHLELLPAAMRAGPKAVSCPWGHCQLSGPAAGKFKLLSVATC